MKDQDKSKQQLISELGELRQRVASQERAEGALQESEERFRKVFEEGPLGIVLLDLDVRIRRCNHRFCEMLGYSEDEIIALGPVGITHPDDWEMNRQFGLRLARGEIPHYTIEKRYVRKDGTVFWGQLTVSRMHDAEGRPVATICMIEDIAERKRTEAALRESERTLQTLMDASPESILLIDADETIVFANSTMARRFGTTADRIVGHTSYDLVSPELAAKRMERLKEVVRTGKAIRFEDERSGRYLEIAMHPVLDEQGKVAAVAAFATDQTERKRAEAALKQAHDELERRVEERTAELVRANQELTIFHRFVEASQQGFGMSRLSGEITYVNPAISRLFAEGRSEDMIGKQVSMCYPEEYMHRREKEIIPTLLREGHWEGEVALSPPSGSIVALQNSFLVRDEQGDPAYLATVLTDITERKRAEEALQQAHDELQAVYDGMYEGLLILDYETKRLVRVNSSLCRLVGYTEEELLSMSVLDIHPPDEAPGILRMIQARVAIRYRGDVDIPVLRKDGSTFYANVLGNPLVFCGRQCIAAFFRDVTERRQAQAALRQSHDELQAIYDGMADGLLMADVETKKFVRANASICRMTGYSEKELLSMSVMDIHPAVNLPAILETFQAQAEDRLRVGADLPVLRKDGSEFFADITTNRILYKDRPCLVGFFRDISERKGGEEALQREQRTLKHLLESSDHERQLIAYEIHDELAQQLVGAIMQFQTYSHLKDKKPRLAAKAYDAGMAMLQQGHSEARRLISGVRPPILDEEGVVAAVAHLVNEQSCLNGTKIEYHNRVDFDRLAPILENAIYRIVQEGLANARQHSRSEKVRVSLVQRKGHVWVEVRDWGIGFNPTEAKEGCYGLVGLQQRARLLGGRCNIRSTMGKGTRVAVELPVVVRESDG